ncbi:hypothetical protein DMA11_14870 [Marinilabiliaceae bacterium JC017]|nr:hypothetical protein DMA11_14870 [Marinilabiliaceae bacterium JC017]
MECVFRMVNIIWVFVNWFWLMKGSNYLAVKSCGIVNFYPARDCNGYPTAWVEFVWRGEE